MLRAIFCFDSLFLEPNISETVILVAMAAVFAAYYLYRETDLAMPKNSTSIFTEIGLITLLPVAHTRHSRLRTGL